MITFRAIGTMMFTLIWPIWPFILQVGLVAYWGTTCLYLASTSRSIYQTTNSDLLNSSHSFTYQTSTQSSATVRLLMKQYYNIIQK